MARSNVFAPGPITLQADIEQTFPDPAGSQTKVPQNATNVHVTLALALADKLATGVQLTVNSFLSSDSGASWQFVNGFTWNSYGPTGLVVTAPDGTVLTNPDPELGVPLNGRKGDLIRVTTKVNRQLTVSPVIAVS